MNTPAQDLDRGGFSERSRFTWIYAVAVVGGVLLMGVFGGSSYALAAGLVGAAALSLAYAAGGRGDRTALIHRFTDRRDLAWMTGIFAIVVVLYRVAFVVIDNNDLLLFACFAAGLLVGVAGPVYYTVWVRKRSLATLGLSRANLHRVAILALLFASVQFSITLWGYDLPEPRGWVTLLGMALMVGIFESIFFRGFVQGRLEASFGSIPAVFGAAALYGVYHVGYGMGWEETIFLGGLGVVYALAYLSANSVFVLWPLLTPLGSLFAQLEDGNLVGRLPWAALMGFADVVAVMATIIWFAHRHEVKAIRDKQHAMPGVHTEAA